MDNVSQAGRVLRSCFNKRMGPAPYASIEDLSDEMDTLGEEQIAKASSTKPVGELTASQTGKKLTQCHLGDSGGGGGGGGNVNSIDIPTNNFCSSSQSAGSSPMINRITMKTTTAPRIDISRASSSSHHDSRDSSPEREIVDDNDATHNKLGMGFKEDGALDLRSSTEELDFQETYEYKKNRNKSVSCSSPAPDDPYMDHRKDSQCSDIVLLSISGRTSRLSSIGSQGSGHSRLSNNSHLSVTSGQSAYSRCSSPHKTLLETSFCGNKLEGHQGDFEKIMLSSRQANNTESLLDNVHIGLGNIKNQNLIEVDNPKVLKQPSPHAHVAQPHSLSNHKPHQHHLGSKDSSSPAQHTKLRKKNISKGGVEYIYIPLKGPMPPDDSDDEIRVSEKSSRKSIAPAPSTSRTKHQKPQQQQRKVTTNHPKQSSNPPAPAAVTPKNVEPHYIRIKLKPDECYEGEENSSVSSSSKPSTSAHNSQESTSTISKPRTLNIPGSHNQQEMTRTNLQVDGQFTGEVIKKHARSLTNTPSVSPKFTRRKVCNGKEGSGGGPSPSSSVSRRNSFACLFRSRDAVVSPDSQHKRKNTLTGILKTSGKGSSKSKLNAPSSTESIDSKGKHKSVFSIFKGKTKEENRGIDKKKVLENASAESGPKGPSRPRPHHFHEIPLSSESVRIPLHSPTYYEDKSNFLMHSSQDSQETVIDVTAVKSIDVPISHIDEEKENKNDSSVASEICIETKDTMEDTKQMENSITIIETPKQEIESITTVAELHIRPQSLTDNEDSIAGPSVDEVPILQKTAAIEDAIVVSTELESDGVNNVVLKQPAKKLGTNDEDRNSSESERDSVEDYMKGAKHAENDHLAIECKAIVLQQDSFEDELPYVPTTLPLERSAALPIIPSKQRCPSSIKTCPIERPRSTTPIHSATFVENYCEEYVGKVMETSTGSSSSMGGGGGGGAGDHTSEKLKITLPRSDIASKTTKEDTPPPLPPKGVQKQWINFEEVPERRRQPKRIQTIPSRGHIDVPELPVKDNVVYAYVNPEECKCECHELKEKEKRCKSEAINKPSSSSSSSSPLLPSTSTAQTAAVTSTTSSDGQGQQSEVQLRPLRRDEKKKMTVVETSGDNNNTISKRKSLKQVR